MGIIFYLSSQIILRESLQILLSTIIFIITFKTRFWTAEAVADESLHSEHPTSSLYATVDRKALKKTYNIDEAVNTEKGFLHFVYKWMFYM